MPYIPNVHPTTSDVVAPNSYRLRSVILTNHTKTKEVDIRNLVTDFTISESIYLQTVMLSMNIKDFANVMERMGISGQERITVSYDRKGIGEEESQVSHTFVVTEYPVYGKFNNRVQVYTVRGVSEHAFLSRLKRISRAKKDSVQNIISEILQKDLGYPKDSISVGSESASIVDVVIPYSHPMDSIHWLTRRAFDPSGAPFYCYETLGGKMVVESLGEMISREPYRTYRDGKFFTNDPRTPEDYEERVGRILSIASDLNLSKFASASAGAYASATGYLDIHGKSFTVENFSYDDSSSRIKTLNPGKPFSDGFSLENDLPLTKYPGSLFNYIPTNSSRVNSYNSLAAARAINLAQSYVENMDTMVHDVTVMGDLKLKPGMTVDLLVPRAIDPDEKVKNTEYASNLDPDELISGKYLITSVIHQFDSEYNCILRVKKDSFKKDYFDKTSK